jgi:hypothetical protein
MNDLQFVRTSVDNISPHKQMHNGKKTASMVLMKNLNLLLALPCNFIANNVKTITVGQLHTQSLSEQNYNIENMYSKPQVGIGLFTFTFLQLFWCDVYCGCI